MRNLDLGPQTEESHEDLPLPVGGPWPSSLNSLRNHLTAWHRRIGLTFRRSDIRVSDPMRAELEILQEAPLLIADSIVHATQDAVRQLERSASEHAQVVGGYKEAAEAQQSAARTAMLADQEAIKRELTKAVLDRQEALISIARRSNYGRAFAVAAPALLLAVGVGWIGGSWWTGQGAPARELAASAAQVSSAAAQVSATLTGYNAAITRESQLYRDAMRLATSSALSMRPGIDAVAKLGEQAGRFTELSNAARLDALTFGGIENVPVRANMLQIARLAATRSKLWPDENTFPGCAANGPTIKLLDGAALRTCLVALPDSWEPQSDTNVRNWYIPPTRR